MLVARGLEGHGGSRKRMNFKTTMLGETTALLVAYFERKNGQTDLRERLV